MGGSGSKASGDDVEDAGSLELDEKLLQDRLRELFHFKILLLGAGESGKSTIVKQLRLIHNKKMTREELISVGDNLHQNVIDCLRALLNACEQFEYKLDDPEDFETAQKIESWPDAKRLTEDMVEPLINLYNSSSVKKAYGRRSEFWLLDSCSYYFKNLDRFLEEDFLPTEEDVVMARIRTTGIITSELEQKMPASKPGEPDTIKFSVVDVGGQRNERKKWIHCFDDVSAILFIVNLAGYNQVMFEDIKKNRMEESLAIFHQITRKPAFAETPIFLFLNKKDLFETAIKDTDLKVAFDDYTGGADVKKALEFVGAKFKAILPAGKDVEIQAVAARVKRDVRFAFEEVKDRLYKLKQPMIEKEKEKIRKEVREVQRAQAGGGCC